MGVRLNALVSEPVSTTITFAIILAGIPVYLVAFAGPPQTARASGHVVSGFSRTNQPALRYSTSTGNRPP